MKAKKKIAHYYLEAKLLEEDRDIGRDRLACLEVELEETRSSDTCIWLQWKDLVGT